MGLSEEETVTYAKDVVRSDFEEAGDHDVVRKVFGDLTSGGGGRPTRPRSARRSPHKEVEARRQIIEADQRLRIEPMPMAASEIERLIRKRSPMPRSLSGT